MTEMHFLSAKQKTFRERVMSLAENLHFHKSASIAFDWSNALGAKPQPLYVNPQSSYFASGNPYTSRKSKSKRRKILLFLLLFFFCRYVNFVDSICFHYAANPKSSFFASGNPSRSSSIYCRSAPIRYEINPSFAKQTYRVRQHISNAIGVYRKSREGFISMRVFR